MTPLQIEVRPNPDSVAQRAAEFVAERAGAPIADHGAHLRDSVPSNSAADVRAMPVNADDLDRAADQYARLLPEEFDLVHLGLGPDGHTASLVPAGSRARKRA